MDLGVSTVEITGNEELELTLDSITLLWKISFFFFFLKDERKIVALIFFPKKDKSILLNSNLPTDSKMPGASRANQFHQRPREESRADAPWKNGQTIPAAE